IILADAYTIDQLSKLHESTRPGVSNRHPAGQMHHMQDTLRKGNKVLRCAPSHDMIEFDTHTTPPFYKIEDVTVPVAIWSGGKDIATNTRNVESLLPRILHLVFYKNIPDWEHFDPLLGLDAPQRFYPDMLELMQKYKD
uniref:Uncharacterized protein n=1 Tax=Laticauda laticaudata TaxID=8630 RepID=A0A8C5WWU8_LATLA